MQRRSGLRRAPPPALGNFPYAALNRLLWLLLMLALALWALAWVRKDRLPDADFYDQSRLVEPRQEATAEQPFQVDAGGIRYRIEPVADYELDGVVVSYHDSDAFSDIYHHKDWKDFLNIRDLCVIWGRNVGDQVYRELKFENSTWTCWMYAPTQAALQRFRGDQLSNNHLLAADRRVQEAIMAAQPGDQIRFRGLLARYSHSNGAFQRGTSTVRTDTGNGACETVFVRDFQVLEKANQGWRQLYGLAKWAAILCLIGLLILLFVAPPRAVRG
jgi:hypothetical protein